METKDKFGKRDIPYTLYDFGAFRRLLWIRIERDAITVESTKYTERWKVEEGTIYKVDANGNFLVKRSEFNEEENLEKIVEKCFR